MKIFLSWSGDRSREVAGAFRSFLPRVVQAFDPWLSTQDLSKGAAWIEQIGRSLRESNGVGYFFVTREAQQSKWLHFEAGAIAALAHSRVCVIRVDLGVDELASPLNLFQSTDLASRDDIRQLLQDTNRLLSRPVPDADFNHFFDAAWNDALREINDALARTAVAAEAATGDGHTADQTPPNHQDLAPLLHGVSNRLAVIEQQLASLSNPYLVGELSPVARGLASATKLGRGLRLSPTESQHTYDGGNLGILGLLLEAASKERATSDANPTNAD